MQLTQFTDLGMRAVMRLAAATDDRPTSRTIADELAVSYNHITKVITRLAELGVVAPKRGRGGGLAITELGRTAHVGWLVRRLENLDGTGEAVECEGPNPCPLRFGCRLRSSLRQAQNAFYDTLDEFTIEDLIREPTNTVLLALPRVDGRPQKSAKSIGE